MTETSKQPESSSIERLEEHWDRGKNLALSPSLSLGQVRMWTALTREPIKRIFGYESPVLIDWPPASALQIQGDHRVHLQSRLLQIECLISMIRECERKGVAPVSRVFIGHGRSPVWRELKDFLSDRLDLPWDEFNRESTAGIPTAERLTEMLKSVGFAFLIMTAEDEHADETLHARENVIHEVGLFQGRLGMRRAIILLEEGCSTFSNIHGLTYIPFPRDNISASFENVRKVLERERFIGSNFSSA
jgi:hypothetical protein